MVRLRAGAALPVQDLVIHVPDLPAMQVNSLIGQEMTDGPIDSLIAVIGEDVDEGAVDVENDAADVHVGAFRIWRAS